jgi:REP element-mobilizing transposase RayT
MYHVTTATADRKPTFANLVPGRLIVQSLMRLEESGRATTMAFVIMPDHLHWLFQLTGGSNLSSTVGSLKSQTSNSIGLLMNTPRPVWQRGFYDRALRRNDDVMAVARYIVANPLRAGLVRKIGDYSLWYSIWV